MTENVQKKFEELSVQELKALAYDQLATLEVTQNNLKLINNRIAELSKPATAEEVKTE